MIGVGANRDDKETSRGRCFLFGEKCRLSTPDDSVFVGKGSLTGLWKDQWAMPIRP